MKKLLKISMCVCLSIVLIIAILFIALYVYLNNSIKCEATKIWLDEFSLEEDYTRTDSYKERLKSDYGLTDNEIEDLYLHSGNYMRVSIDYSAENKTDSFGGIEAQGKYKKGFAVGTKFLTPLPDIPEMYIHQGENSEMLFCFLINSKGKTTEEVFNTIKKGNIYITGKWADNLPFRSKWKLDMSTLQTYSLISEVKKQQNDLAF